MSNRSAFLATIAACEGADYHTLYGGGTFPDFSKHPRQAITAGGYTSTAAGRYQILASTWDDFCKARGSRPFDERGQDDCAVWLIERRGALQAVDDGYLERAIGLCGKEWASLPGSPYGQPTRTMDYCRTHYLAAGGALAGTEQPAAPIEDHSDVTFTVGGADNSNTVTQGGPVPFLPVMLSLLPSVLNLFAPRAQAALQKVTAQPPDVVQGFVQSLFDKLGQLTGTTDPIQATAAITRDPAQAKVDALQEHALDYLDKLAPVIDKLAAVDQQTWAAEIAGRDAASKRIQAEKWDMTPWLVWMAGGCVSLGVVALLGTILFQATTGERQIDTALLTFAGPLITMAFLAWKEIFAYRFDGNKESSATNAALTEMARQGSK